jgi:hypothetical protein
MSADRTEDDDDLFRFIGALVTAHASLSQTDPESPETIPNRKPARRVEPRRSMAAQHKHDRT